MLSALAFTDVFLSHNSLGKIMPTAGGENGERRTPTLVPLSPCNGGSAVTKRSCSPAVNYSVNNSSNCPAMRHGSSRTESIGSTCSAGITDTLPQRQSTQPRATSTSLVSSSVTKDNEWMPSSSVRFAADIIPTLVSSSGNCGSAIQKNPCAGTSHSSADASALATNNVKADDSVATGPVGGKPSKRVQKTASGVNARRRGNSSNSGNISSSGADSRSAAELCKAARTLAAELMSTLMERPPQAAQIAQYRQFINASANATPNSALDVADATSRHSSTELATSQAPPAQHRGETGGAAPAGSSSSHSFLEAVRNGLAKSSHSPSEASGSTTATGKATTAVTTISATSYPSISFQSSRSDIPFPALTTTGLRTGRRSGNSNSSWLCCNSPNPAMSPPAGMSGEVHRRKSLELMPEDTATIPQLLGVLREIALSCASLDTLGRAADPEPNTPSPGPSNNYSSNNSGGGELMKQTTDASAVTFPSTPSGEANATDTQLADVSASNTTASPVMTNIMSRHHHGVEALYYEEQWQRVRAHLQAVRALVLNGHELANTLDETLGTDWRVATSTESTKNDRESSANTSPLPAPILKDGEEEDEDEVLLRAAVKEGITAASSMIATADTALVDAVVPVMPTPVDHVGPSQSTKKTATVKLLSNSAVTVTTATKVKNSNGNVTNGGAGNATAEAVTAATTTTTTTLNYNARPFHSRSPPTSRQPMSTQVFFSCNTAVASPSLNAAASSPNSGTDGASDPHANANNNVNNNYNVASSMKQLSETSSTYSPSQHVTTFLERSTPPASGRLVDDGDGGLLNFPSTPLSEAAAPYQPSMLLVGGTTPRGGNASASSSTPFHLESREEMLRRRSAAPNAFYASMTHSGTTHYLGGPPSAATTPGTFVPSSVPQGPSSFALAGRGARSMPVSPLMSYVSAVSATPCPYDYMLVLDFEATCEEHPPPNYLYEIIEFPVVVVDVRLQRVVAEFHRFVRPRHKVELSYFCRELTGMRQEDVDTAAPLEEVILQFERWFAHTVPPHARCIFATDGPTDLREFMYHHSVSRQGIRFPPLFYQYVDVKQTFACFFQCSQGKIKAMLEVLHVPFEGRLHSGLDDARNIASIVIGLLQYGCNFCDVPLNRLPLNGLLLTRGTAAAVGAPSSGSTPLSLPPSTAATTDLCRTRAGAGSPTYITAPYSIDED